MCGRAGRRGKDEKGNVFILLGDKRNPPLSTDLEKMINGEGDKVESKFYGNDGFLGFANDFMMC